MEVRRISRALDWSADHVGDAYLLVLAGCALAGVGFFLYAVVLSLA